MGFADVWNRTLVYFGIAEEEEDWDEDGYLTEEDLERTYSERPNVRRLTPRRRQHDFDDWTDPEPDPDEVAAPRTAVMRPRGRRSDGVVRAVPSVQVHLVVPRSFNDAQQIADRFKDSMPVILNLQGSDQELSKQFIDVFIYVYVLLIFVYVLTSWVRLPYTPWVRRISDFLRDVCEPYLRLFRRILPPLGPLDLSPVVAIVVLFVLMRVIDALFNS